MPDFFPAKFAGGYRRAECVWAVPPANADMAALRTWPGLVTMGVAKETEAADIAQSAVEKWEHEIASGAAIASSVDGMKAFIRANGDAEVIGMILAKADYVAGGVLGVCLFHRTWSNGIFLDYLAANPVALQAATEVRGVGAGLLYILSDVALQLSANSLKMETTRSSVGFYCGLFGVTEEEDILKIRRTELDAFYTDRDTKYKGLPLTGGA